MRNSYLLSIALVFFSTITQAGGFIPVSDLAWDKNAVRRVLHVFAFGGQMSEAEIQLQADLPPEVAIKNLLNFSFHNPVLSPSQKSFAYPFNQQSIEALGQFWSSNHPENPIPEQHRRKFQNYNGGQVNATWTWLYATLARGYNPFRQKIGLWETNYHLAVNLNAGVAENQVVSYYDDILTSLADIKQPYQQTLANAAASAAIAVQYGHRNNIFKDGICVCNDDFAREYHQLFFGILGAGDSEYHENTSIKNTAKALTGIKVAGRHANAEYTGVQHYPDDLEILHQPISGRNSLHRLMMLSDVAINHTESLQNLPVIIIRQLADDNITSEKATQIRAAWAKIQPKNLLTFLQQYAISTQFHSPNRYKYLTTIERHLILLNQLILNDAEIFNYLRPYLYAQEGMSVFRPAHNVFGGQTSEEAINSSLIFLKQYNLSTARAHLVSTAQRPKLSWKKDWSLAFSEESTFHYQADQVGELLWQRLIGDGLKNYGILERAYVNALLARGLDLATVLNFKNPDRLIDSTVLKSSAKIKNRLKQNAQKKLALNSLNPKHRIRDNHRIGLAINFIVATPYMFAGEGG